MIHNQKDIYSGSWERKIDTHTWVNTAGDRKQRW